MTGYEQRFEPPGLDGDSNASTEARVCAARALYQNAVAAYLGAPDDAARAWLGEAMYFAQLATIEARFNPQGSAQFRALAEARLGISAGVPVVAPAA